jgi:hypothetical protein
MKPSKNFTLLCKYYGILEPNEHLNWYLNDNLIDNSNVKFHITETNYENYTISLIEFPINNNLFHASCSFRGLSKTIKLIGKKPYY